MLNMTWVMMGPMMLGRTSLKMMKKLPAIANARTMLRLPKEGIGVISNLDEKTAKLQLLFSLLFTVTFLI